MRDKVLRNIRDRRMMRAGDRIVVAVSGGADSVALLRVLLELRPECGLVLGVAHFNHGLRGEQSDADEAFVTELARDCAVEFFVGHGDVRSHAFDNKLSIEAAGRGLRYGWLRTLAAEQRFDAIATAHTLDDQAETVLLKFLRGTGTRGLAGIYPVLDSRRDQVTDPEGNRSGDSVRIVRPLLCVSRVEVESYLTSLGQSWREDESNLDRRFLRNRVRHDLLPLLEREFNPQVRSVLSGVAEVSRAEEEYWQSLVDHEMARRLNLRGDGGTAPHFGAAPQPGHSSYSEPASSGSVRVPSAALPRLDLRGFSDLPLALQRRLLKRLVETPGLALDFDRLEMLRRCAVGELARTEVSGGWLAERRGDSLELSPPQHEPDSVTYEYLLPIPGEVRIAELGLALRALPVAEKLAGEMPRGTLLSGDLVGPELRVRNWRPGDRLWPAGCGSEEKLKRLFAEKHISVEQRRSWPVVLKGEQIVWVRAFPPSRSYAWKGSGPAVKIEVKESVLS